MTFRDRTDRFWKWFSANEETLSDFLLNADKHSEEEIKNFVLCGLSLLSDGARFHMEGDFAFSFSVNGREALYYLLPYVVSRAPKALQNRWRFSPFLPASVTEEDTVTLLDETLPVQDVLIDSEYVKETNQFDLSFYSERLHAMDRLDRFYYFQRMLELSIGECAARLSVRKIREASRREVQMIPVLLLKQKIDVCNTRIGIPQNRRPDEVFFSYEGHPKPNGALRQDIILGTTCCTKLLDDCRYCSAELADSFIESGAHCAYLAIPFQGIVDRDELLDFLYDLEDRVQQEVLGEKGSGLETGMVLGGAVGINYLYVDLLLFDLDSFLETVPTLLKEFPFPVKLCGFSSDVPPQWLNYQPSPLAEKMVRRLDCPCEVIPPLKGDGPIASAYHSALEQGWEQGFTPVLLLTEEPLLECIQQNDSDALDWDKATSAKALSKKRKAFLKQLVFPCGCPEFFSNRLQELQEEFGDEWDSWSQDLFGEFEPGNPLDHFLSYWEKEPNSTDELILAKIPVKKPWEIFAWIPMGGWNDCPDTEDLIIVSRYWNQRYGAVPAVLTSSTLEYYLPQPVADPDAAYSLAKEQYLFCTDRVEQCLPERDTVGALAGDLLDSKVWYFWWD